MNFVPSTVGSGRDAIAELVRAASDPDDEPYDLVLMDWKMPEMDGIETSRIIQRSSDLTTVPVIIMVTAYGREDVMRKADEANLDGIPAQACQPLYPVRFRHVGLRAGRGVG